MSFSATGSGSSVNIANADGHFNITSGTSFTIEWFQYLLSGQSSPRPFAIGSYGSSNTVIGVSLEPTSNTTFIFWDGARSYANITITSPVNAWVHFAIVGDGSTIRIYRNGTQFLTRLYTSFSSTLTLAIGNETVANASAAFKGYITNFRWVTGTAVYTGTFTRPSQPLTAIAGTRLLLLASDSASVTTDSSSNSRSTTTTGTVSWVSNSPFS